MSEALSVVMPVHDEAAHLPATIDSLVEAVERSGFDAELLLIDDGSSDGSAAAARAALRERLPLRVVPQPNSGRFEARRAGLEAASADWILLLDARIRLDADALAFVHGRVRVGDQVWNGHVRVDTRGNPYAAFWQVLVELAWREYFDAPRTTSFDSESFDRYPKGTSCFLAPRDLLLEAVGAFETSYATTRLASDDTQLIRDIARSRRIHVSPGFACEYVPRSTFKAFMRNGLYRGTTFVDGHGRRESRFFPVVVAFFPASVVLAVASLRRAWLPAAVGGAAVVVAGAAAVHVRRSLFDRVAFAVLTPVYSIAHGAGMWRGLALLLRGRVARATDT